MPIQFPNTPGNINPVRSGNSTSGLGQVNTTGSATGNASASPASQEPVDTVTLGQKQETPEPSSSFFRSLKQTFSAASSSLKPLDFTDNQKKDGQESASTLDRLAGADGKWSADDISNNMAQINFPKSIKGMIGKRLVAGNFMEAHGIPADKQDEIMKNADQIRKDNPDIAKMRKLERYDPSKFKKPETLQKYNTMKSELTESLSGKGLMPVSLDQVQDFGKSADLLKGKLNEAGLPQPKPGTPVDPKQFRGLFEGKSPLSTQFSR